MESYGAVSRLSGCSRQSRDLEPCTSSCFLIVFKASTVLSISWIIMMAVSRCARPFLLLSRIPLRVKVSATPMAVPSRVTRNCFQLMPLLSIFTP